MRRSTVERNKDEVDGLVVITGASSGIGEATAYRLSRREGIRLLLSGRNEDHLIKVAEKCHNFGSTEVEYHVGNLRDRSHIKELIKKCHILEPIKALINCAGLGYFGPTAAFSDDEWDEIIDVNLTATFLLCRDVGAMMIQQERVGTIVNVSSDADSVGFSEATAYCASKGGVLAMTRALQLEMQPRGVRVCTISPGRVDTCFNKKKPGMRPGALTSDEVAEVIEFALCCSPNIELREIRIDSISRLS